MRTLRARWVAVACVAVTGCGADTLTPLETGAAGMPSASSGSGASTGGSPASGSGGATGGAGTSGVSTGGGTGGGGSGSGGSGGGSGSGGSGFGGAGGTGIGAGGFGGSAGRAVAGSGGSAVVGGTGGAAPTFTEIWNRTLENGCAVPYCHDGSGKGWSGFDQATAYRTLVGAASTTCPGETRVVPGNPSESVLAAAISHVDLGACDVPTMPRDRAKLAQADIDRIIAWINAGARDD